MPTSPIEFVDFDNQNEFNKAFLRAKAHPTKNFVVEFNADQAKCAFDLDESQIGSLLEPRTHDAPPARPATRQTRWIHIWRPEDQKETIRVVAKHYGFSPRLTLSMEADPMTPQPVINTISRTPSRYRDLLLANRSKRSLAKRKESEKSATPDVESRDSPGLDTMPSALDLNHYRIVNELWNFTSVDWGHKCKSSSVTLTAN